MDAAEPDALGPSRRPFAGRLAAAWLALTLLPVHNLIHRPNTEAVSQAGIEPVIELAYFGVCGLLALSVIRTIEGSADRARPPVVVYALPVWFVLSSLWSDTGAYALVRGAQMGAVATLAWATIAVGRASAAELHDTLATYLRWLVRATFVLAALGLAFGPILVPASEQNLARFSWIGAHPNGSGLVLALAIVTLVSTPSSALRLRPATRVMATAVLGLVLYHNQSRTAWGSLAAGLAVLALVAAVRHPRFRLGLPVGGLAALGTVLVLWAPISEYFLRGQRPGSLATGNGRLRLWPIGFDALHTPFDWVCGLGYGAARTVFVAEFSWAKTAHSSVLALLVSGGLVAVGLFVLLVVATVRAMRRGRLPTRSPFGLAVPALLATVVANGVTTDILAEPNIGFAVLGLVFAVSEASASSPGIHAAGTPAFRARAPLPPAGR